MKRRRWLLAAAAVLFAVWVGHLAFMALMEGRPVVVLSRPQFLVADLWVIAQVDDLDGSVEVREVAYAKPEAKADVPKEGTKIDVRNLGECKEETQPGWTKPGWTKPRAYILPLSRQGQSYVVTAVPHSPGYDPRKPQFPIYPDTSATRAQLSQMLAALKQ